MLLLIFTPLDLAERAAGSLQCCRKARRPVVQARSMGQPARARLMTDAGGVMRSDGKRGSTHHFMHSSLGML